MYNVSLPFPLFGTRQIPWLRDARHFQIAYLTAFLLYGIVALGWAADWMKLLVLVSTCVAVQLGGVILTNRDYSSVKSALITALGLTLLFKSSELHVLMLGAALAILSKFVIRWKGTHFFNPANFGIIMAIILTGDAWISPGQWGSSAILLYFFGAAGLMVLLKCGRIDTSLAFLGTFGVLEFLRTVVYLGWEWDVFTHKMCNGSLLLFAFFMITDPKTTPRSPKARILWAVGIAGVTFIVSNWMYVHTAPMWVLFFAAPITVVLNQIFKHKQFQW
jgi:Na+-transporting NADH:ubiquinone oxidoreductase subunit NqrB